MVPVGAYIQAGCGNGIVDAGEECDAGDLDTLTCDGDCTLVECGDAYVNEAAGEECDGDLGSCDLGCNSDCTCVRPTEIPMLPSWGLLGVGLLLLAGGTVVFRRRSVEAS